MTRLWLARACGLALGLLACGHASTPRAEGAAPWGDLRDWTEQYPTRRDGPERRNLFTLAPIRAALAELLTASDRRLLGAFEVESRIQRDGEYVVSRVCRKHDCGGQWATVVLDTHSRRVWVSFVGRAGPGVSLRVFATGSWDTLPEPVRNRMLATGPTP